MKKFNYLSIVTLIGLMMLINSCQDSQILNPMTSADSNDMQLTALSATGVDEVGVAGVFIDPINNLELSQAQLTAGYEVDVNGYVGFKSNTSGGNHPKLTELKLEVERNGSGSWNQIYFWDTSNLQSIVLTTRSNKPGRDFTDAALNVSKWTIGETGSYIIKATAKFTNEGSFSPEAGTEDVVVTLLQTVNVEFPAAPAIAARILEANDINARYGSSRTGGNYISDVAKLMGPGTNFNGVPKELWENGEKVMNQAYWDAVWNYLGTTRGLYVPNAPAGYIW